MIRIMTYTALLSISTAFIEFATAIFILFYYKKTSLGKIIPVFLIFLGLFQFAEYMICTSDNPILWGKIAFLSYNYLPAIFMLFVLHYAEIKFKYSGVIVLFLPTLFVVWAFLQENFMTLSVCDAFFVSLRHGLMIYQEGITLDLPPLLFTIQYFGYGIINLIILLKLYQKEWNPIRKKIDLLLFATAIFARIPAVLLLIILPALGLYPLYMGQIPSIYSMFAVILILPLLYLYNLDAKKIEIKESIINPKRK